MPATETILTERFRDAIAAVLGDQHADADPLIRPSTNPRFGDFQANAAMGLAKQVGAKPRELAERIVAALKLDGVCDRVEIAGPGFINLTLKGDFVAEQLAQMAGEDRLGVTRADPPQNVVVDYSGPNVAKQMHVGHLRSTVIGDAIARVLDFQGHRVVRQNHLGDWGTQFGMLIVNLYDQGQDFITESRKKSSSDNFKLPDLEAFYQEAKRRFDEDAGFAEQARLAVVALQSGDGRAHAMWRLLRELSQQHFDAVYERLHVLLTKDDVRGESFYNDKLPDVVGGLDEAGVLKESEGAKVVFPPGFEDRDGKPLPLIVQKSDGGYLYATTDLAAARYRIDELHADRIIYVTDARQSQHFAMVFATLRLAKWAPDTVKLEHVPFGTVLGKDMRPFKTREGGTVKLADLLDEAEKRAGELIAEKNPSLPAEQRERIAHAVGIGALKYADLSSDRIKDYVFDWDRMLAFEGNTAPYLQNAYVRIQSIFRKGEIDPATVRGQAIGVDAPAERMLALGLLRFGPTVEAVAQSLEPHRLCTYLYELASAFHKFYETCPVLAAGDEPSRLSRLALCDLTARTLRRGLDLLGIEVLDQM